MKTSNIFSKLSIIFCLLAITFFSACSSKEAVKTQPEINGKFVFSSNRDPKMKWSVYVYKSGKIIFLEKQVGYPVWSPNGKMIACMSREGLVLLSEEGKKKKIIKTLFNDYPSEISWSSDGKQIYYTTSTKEYGRKTNSICVFNLDLETQECIYAIDGNYSIIHMSVSPQDNKIVFVRETDSTFAGVIYIMDIDGKNVEPIRKNASSPSWFPDGKHIGFTTNLDEEGNRLTKEFGLGSYFKININTKEIETVRKMKYFFSPKLSKDGKYLYYTRSTSQGRTAKAIFISPLYDNEVEIQITYPVQLIPSDLYSQDDSPDWCQDK